MAIEIKLIQGEEFRDKIVKVREKLKGIPLGNLVVCLSNFIAYQGRIETDEELFESPDYQCVRELLQTTIYEITDEINSREQKYLGR